MYCGQGPDSEDESREEDEEVRGITRSADMSERQLLEDEEAYGVDG